MLLPFAEMKILEEDWLEENDEFSFEHAEFNVSVRYSSGEVN